MGTAKVEFLFDFGSPNAYLAQRVIPQIEARTGVKFEYVPILLGGVFKLTGNKSPAESFAGIRNKPEFMQIEMQRFIDKHGIREYRRNPYFPVITTMLMRGAVAAQDSEQRVFDGGRMTRGKRDRPDGRDRLHRRQTQSKVAQFQFCCGQLEQGDQPGVFDRGVGRFQRADRETPIGRPAA